MRVHADGRRGKWWLKLSSLVVAATARRAPDSQTLIARLRARSDRDPCVSGITRRSLSISISGGKETYKDSLSNGERTGNSPALESGGPCRPNCSPGEAPWRTGPKSPEGAPERVRAPLCRTRRTTQAAVTKSGCLGMQPKSGGEFRPRLNTGETDSVTSTARER
ncbi:hypothetical protein H5410_064023 [Solanum commersonii]|uniref:Uncharacterized protein n=1 Tax=Solanum commersonii TaxID=4109 RepID=A0A9J5W0H2_SOLCO|nr:hypothetical protein H5410_064023 [Solanum commersonii]